jgi:hypothetical protein
MDDDGFYRLSGILLMSILFPSYDTVASTRFSGANPAP